MKAGSARYTLWLTICEPVRPHTIHQHIALFASRDINIAVRSDCENSRVAHVLGKFLDPETRRHMKLREVGGR